MRFPNGWERFITAWNVSKWLEIFHTTWKDSRAKLGIKAINDTLSDYNPTLKVLKGFVSRSVPNKLPN